MNRHSIDHLLAKRGQRSFHKPAENLAISTDFSAPLNMQNFPHRGLAPKSKPVITPVKFQSGELLVDTQIAMLNLLDTIRPKKGKC